MTQETTTSAETPTTESQHSREGVRAVHASLQAEHTKMLAGGDTGRDPESPEGKVLGVFNNYQTAEGLKIKKEGGGRDVMMTDFKGKDSGGVAFNFPDGEVRMAGFAGEEVNADGIVVLRCYFEDKDGNPIKDTVGRKITDTEGTETTDDRLLVPYTRDEVIQMHIQAHPDQYQPFFQGDTQPLFDAYTGKEKFGGHLDAIIDTIEADSGLPVRDKNMPQDTTGEDEQGEDEGDPRINHANEAIANQILGLQAKLQGLTAQDTSKMNRGEKNSYQAEMRSTQLALGKMQVAMIMDGEIGVGVKYQLLEQAMQRPDIGPAARSRIEQALKDLKPLQENAAEALTDLIGATDLSPKKIAGLTKAISNDPTELLKLLEDPEFTKLDGLAESFFGEKFSDANAATIDTGLKNIADALLDESQKELFLKFGKKVGKGGLIALLIALGAAIAVPVVGGGMIAVSAAGAGKGR